MSSWNLVSEEASIVLVGNLNPAIFHPEWFIRKGIVEDWDHGKDDNLNVPDLARVSLPSNRMLQVFLNKFMVQSSMASDHPALKDLVISTFAALRETPIQQMGMNFKSVLRIDTDELWRQFGSELAPKSPWEEAVTYIADVDPAKAKEFGLWEMTMNLPRPDELKGYIRPKISIDSMAKRELSFSFNNHVQVEDASASTMMRILDENWEKSLDFALNVTKRMMESQLRSM